MTSGSRSDLDRLLIAWGEGNKTALDDLIELVYPELRQIARRHLSARKPGHSLESAALANEAYLKLFRMDGVHCENRTHFFALCAQIIRRILVDHARKRRYRKRGGDAIQVPLEENVLDAKTANRDILDLDEALETLAKVDPRKARVVELRYFGGLTMEEISAVLGVSPETAGRDWKLAKSWLLRELARSDAPR